MAARTDGWSSSDAQGEAPAERMNHRSTNCSSLHVPGSQLAHSLFGQKCCIMGERNRFCNINTTLNRETGLRIRGRTSDLREACRVMMYVNCKSFIGIRGERTSARPTVTFRNEHEEEKTLQSYTTSALKMGSAFTFSQTK